jgi:hypothetical protein
MKHPQPGDNNTASIMQARIIALAIALNPLVYALVSFLLKQFVIEGEGGFVTDGAGAGFLLFPAGMLISAVSIPGAFYLRRRLGAAAAGSIQEKLRVVILSMTLAQAGAVFGLVLFLVTGRLPEGILLMGLGLAASIRLFPGRAWLEKKG